MSRSSVVSANAYRPELSGGLGAAYGRCTHQPECQRREEQRQSERAGHRSRAGSAHRSIRHSISRALPAVRVRARERVAPARQGVTGALWGAGDGRPRAVCGRRERSRQGTDPAGLVPVVTQEPLQSRRPRTKHPHHPVGTGPTPSRTAVNPRLACRSRGNVVLADTRRSSQPCENPRPACPGSIACRDRVRMLAWPLLRGKRRPSRSTSRPAPASHPSDAPSSDLPAAYPPERQGCSSTA